MKRNPNFLLRSVADTLVLVPIAEAADAFEGMITLNNTGAYIWDLLEQPQTVESLAEAIVDRYDVDVQKAQQDVAVFLKALTPAGAILED